MAESFRRTVLKCLGSSITAGLLLPSSSHSQAELKPAPVRSTETPASPAELKAHQRLTSGRPPQSPSIFDPDPNRLQPSAPEWPFSFTNRLFRSSITSTNPPPLTPERFNPDPGALWKNPVVNPAPPQLFADDPLPPVTMQAPTPSAEPPLPRENVRSSVIAPAMNEEQKQPTYGSDPLTEDLQLPRENTRQNQPVEKVFHTPQYSLLPQNLPANTTPQRDRWRVPFMPWRRYTSGDVETPYLEPSTRIWDPYKQSLLKGDAPIIGDDVFLNLTATSVTELEFRRLPTPSGISAAQPGAAEFFGQSEQIALQQYFGFSAELFRGETAFKPVEWAIKVQPVFNINYLNSTETGVVSPDPRGFLGGSNFLPPPNNGGVVNPGDLDALLNGQVGAASGSLTGPRNTVRTKTYLALQEWFAEVHLGDLTDNYDFFAAKLGNQGFNSDFRGFIFNDINLGLRLFGNYGNNRYQYNVGLFDLREKDTNSELNTFDDRDQELVIGNFYWQDFLWKGYTAQLSFHANFDRGDIHYDRNGNIVRPSPVGTVRRHDVTAYYLGWAGDGHIGRVNISHAFYQVLGRDDFNGIAGQPVDINAQMAALELSYDRDWIRYKASAFFASGDSDATDDTGSGFDSIIDNPNFTGGPFSYWTRQGFNFAGSSVALKQRQSLLPNLRTSKTQGQANFVNPGVLLLGLGADIEITPKLRGFLNANYVSFIDTEALETILLTPRISRDVGWDLSFGCQYRPFLTDNVVLSAGFGAFLPGRGYKDIYQTSTVPVPGFDPPDRSGEVDALLYSALVAINLTY